MAAGVVLQQREKGILVTDQTNSEQELASSIQDGIARNFAQQQPVQQDAVQGVQSERLKEMEKRLPEWSLEPPSSFLGE